MCTALGTLGRSAVDCAVATSAEVVRLLRQAKKNQWPARDKVMFPFATPHHKEDSPDWVATKAAGWRHCQFTFKSGKIKPGSNMHTKQSALQRHGAEEGNMLTRLDFKTRVAF